MEESEDNLSSEDLKSTDSPVNVKIKPKKRSLIERELETSLTARITSPVTNCDGTSTSRYGRARRLKSAIDQSDVKKMTSELKSPLSEKSPLKTQTQSPVYKMHASNSPLKRTESPKKVEIEKFLDDQIESIYHENISMSRFGSEEVNTLTPSPPKRLPKVYIRKDLIQNREPEDTVMVIQNMFSPVKSTKKSSNTHLNNILERSSERYNINSKPQNGYLDNSSVVKTLDFDGKRKKKETKDVKGGLSKSELFELEAKCTYQVGDLAWARMGTYPFWPSIVTRDPSSGVFVKKKLFGRIERDVIHVTFFGDNGRRGWIVDSMLRKYLGQLEFEAARENFTPEAKKKDPRLYAAFFVSEKKQALWNNSVEEAEMLLREPKRLRIDIFNDMLVKSRSSKVKQPKSKISRTDSDVSLSESLYDSLFSEDDGKSDNNDRSRNRSRNKSLDMFEVVTACLDNMAAKTGITKIQKQSHMDRWLQKAKSKTPEKTKANTQVPSKKTEEKKETVVKSTKGKKSASTKRSRPVKKKYSLRKSSESQSLQLSQNEQNSSINSQDGNITDSDQTSTDTDSCKHNSTGVNGIGIISKVESLAGKETKNTNSEKLGVRNESATSESPKESLEDINGTCDSETYTDDESQDYDIAAINNTTDKEKQVSEELNVELIAKNNNDSKVSSDSKAVSDDDYSETNNDIENQNSIPEHTENNSNVQEVESQGELKESSDKILDSETDSLSEKDDSDKVLDTETDNLINDDNSKVLECKTGNLTEDDIAKVLDSETDNLIEDDDSHDILDSTDNKIEEDTSALSTSLSKLDSETSNTIESQDSTEETTNTTESEDNTVETSNTTDSQDNTVSNLAEESSEIKLTNEDIKNTRNFESNIETDVSQDTSKKSEEVKDIDSNIQEYKEGSVNKIQDDKETLNIDENEADMSLDDDSDSEPLPYSPLSNLGNNSDDNLSLDDVPFENDLKKSGNNAENKVDNVDHLVDDIEIRNDNFNIDVPKKDNQKIVNNGHILIEDKNAHKESILSQILEYKSNYRKVSNKNVFYDSTQINTESANGNGYRGENVREIEMESKEVRIYVTEKLLEPIKVNGFQEINGDFDVDTASIHSEDSVTSTRSQSKRKLRDKQDKKEENPLENPEFIKYMELRQDAIMDENPELNEKEIVAYLHKTWLYEESLKSDVKKNDDLRECNLVKGLKGVQNESPSRAKKNLSLNKRQSNRNTLHKFISRKRDIEIADVASDEIRSCRRRGVRKNMIKEDDDEEVYRNQAKHRESPRQLQKNVDIPEENVNENPNIADVSVKSIISKDIQENKVERKETEEPDDQSDVTKQLTLANKNVEEPAKNDEVLTGTSSDSLRGTQIETIKDDLDLDTLDSEDSETPLIRCKLRPKPKKKENDIKEGSPDSKIKDEDADTISINSEDSEISITKRKKRLGNKKYENALEDPEFIKYSELRQDALIEENPQLTQDEITAYLYQTWLYEENTKSDIKKSDELEQSTLVKGLKDVQDVQPKKIKRKITKTEKAEKETIDDYTPGKEKPKRKSVKPFYNEEYSDIEEELEVFEIFKPKIKEVPKIEPGQPVPEIEELPEVEVYNEVELYFAELTKPKPNIFKGLLREKVCDICEKTGSLVKCKGCSGMFHVDCVKKQVEITDVPAPTRGRKKKKRVGRKPKNSEEFDNDDKSQDVSEENNASVDEILEADSHTVDADVLETQLSAKMKEILDTAETIEYDSYSSDDGLDWSETIPGKCEIIDVKLKPKSNQIDYSDFKCNNCQKYTTPICFVCKGAVSKKESTKRQKCHVAHCYKYYHLDCLDQWPQTQFNGGEPSKTNKKINEYFEALTCPRHVCHTCVSDDPRGCKTRFSGDKLARCVRCPATYHSFTKCLPAGTQILTASHIICPRHYEHRPGKVPCHVNTGWCFICALGGSLICCEYCPTSFHAECLNIDPPEGGYMCEDCETGRLPLYGEMVWVKLGHYRWWPGIILHPYEIPENLMAVKHSLGEFVVRFFGQYDHYWVNRGRVFPFQEGDSGRISSQKSKIDAAFTTAMEHAQRACEILKTAQPNEEESLDIASSLLPPHYVKLKVNKPCGSLCGRKLEDPESSLTQCECNPLEDDPCGPYSQCLNRMLLTECGPTCRAGERCNNRAFEKRLYPKLVPYRTPSRGWGLKTLEDIKAGQFVIEYVGELIDEEETRRRMRRKHEIRDENFYFLTLDKERMIDAGPKGNLARFMNHCCEPNCETQKWTVLGDVRVGLFALFDIPAHSEVTFNYNLECAGIDKKRCMCGAKRCSGYIGAKPKQDESQTKKQKLQAGKRNKKRKPEESLSTKNKLKRPLGRPPKPRELTEIEKDLLIIKNATNGLSSDESSRSFSSESDRNPKALKRKRVSFSTDEVILCENEPNVKKAKLDDRIEE